MYSRTLDGEQLELAASGWTYGEDRNSSLFVLMDKQTESLWFPMDRDGVHGLVGISGEHTDRFLPEADQLERTTWAQWRERHPDAVFVTE